MLAPLRTRLSAPQLEFVASKAKFPAFVGGFGSGKTHSGAHRAISLKLAYPTCDVAYYLPTYDLVNKIGYPRFEELLEEHYRIPCKINKHEKTIEVGSWGSVIFRTLDKPERIVGYEVADSIVDELDTLPTDKAADCWRKIIARNRQKKPDGSQNTVGVATTPEGFRFVYDRWKKKPTKNHHLIVASTYSNQKHIPADYIEGLLEEYPEALLKAYLMGLFVNLTQGSVYPNFDRVTNGSNEVILPKETLHVGLDFNVTKMAASINVLRANDTAHAVAEIVNVFDTPAMVRMLVDRYKNNGHDIMVYPDASGKARDSNNASESDFKLLRDAGFTVCANTRNPAVRDRIVSTNLAFSKDINIAGIDAVQRRYYVNAAACPHTVEGFEKQSYDKNGEPDKSTGIDHIIDAATYFACYRYPVIKRSAVVSHIRA